MWSMQVKEYTMRISLAVISSAIRVDIYSWVEMFTTIKVFDHTVVTKKVKGYGHR